MGYRGKDLEKLTRDLVAAALSQFPPDHARLYEEVVGRVEKELIHQVLARCDQVQIKAAAQLGLNRNTLRKKLKEWGWTDTTEWPGDGSASRLASSPTEET